ncbi:protein SPIRAL1-like 5 [Phoenix dactylifera]|uniref:Protein SPIRAL1-like 5 n=1 Tax=Phoenix dactylifera TaxID=42345 RepID=A0A8B8ZYB6_PHODC|nr:protein SPIRAL1-like 5 [Phoenix dactylifera]XP_038976289.1 protein SPIRAL1-like 5 [Phoenix dactylifera]
MSRGGSFGGGKSSLGYLFESDEPAISPPGSTKATEPPSDEGSKSKAATQETQPEKPVSNNYHRAQGQNSGNFITGRPSTKVLSAPGGSSSLGYLFGDK